MLPKGESITVSCGKVKVGKTGIITLSEGEKIKIISSEGSSENSKEASEPEKRKRARHLTCQVRAWEMDPLWNAGKTFHLLNTGEKFYDIEEAIDALVKLVDLDSCYTQDCSIRYLAPEYNNGNSYYIPGHGAAFRTSASANDFIKRLRNIELCK